MHNYVKEYFFTIDRYFSHLALRLRVSVVSPLHLPVAGEGRLRHLRVDRVVLPRGARDGLLEHCQVGVAAGAGAVLGLLLLAVLGLYEGGQARFLTNEIYF